MHKKCIVSGYKFKVPIARISLPVTSHCKPPLLKSYALGTLQTLLYFVESLCIQVSENLEATLRTATVSCCFCT